MNLAYREAVGEKGAKPLPGSLRVNPRLSQWLKILREGRVDVASGKVEIGQGILTALAQIAAEELDVALERIRMVQASTAYSPDEAVTSGSLSVQESGTAIRHACAEARAIYLRAAAARLDVPVDSLTVRDGEIVGGSGLRTSYWELADDALLDRDATGTVAPKSASSHAVVGTAAPRRDLADKVFGRACFIHDLELPGMLHARMLRPPSPAATLRSLDDSAVRSMPGVVQVVRDGSFVAVLAETEHAAKRAVGRLAGAAEWSEQANLPDEHAMAAWLKAQPAETTVVDTRAPQVPKPVARTVKATYSRPYVAHASLAPSCALAQVEGDVLRIWTHSQGIYNLRKDLALAFGMPPEKIVIAHVQGAGCYGHNGADDVAFDAARLAKSAIDNRPVRVQWSRPDELAWSPVGAAMAVDVEADLDSEGTIVGWRHDVWSNGHTLRPGRAKTPVLLGGWHLEKPFERQVSIDPPMAGGGGGQRNSVPIYDFMGWTITSHRVLSMPIRTSALRSLGAQANVFAIESFMDELAAEASIDPVEFRLRYLADARARAVVEKAAERAGWKQWKRGEGRGHGIAFARYKGAGAYCAIVAEVEVEVDVRVRRLVIAVDAGLVVNPDGLANQIEGGAVQAASWTLKEAVRFDRTRITSDAWDTYPILRATQTPVVEVHIVSRPDCPASGAGEAAAGPATAAIANAVFDALGVRVRDLPLTADRIRAAMA